jgi:AcrR family transcriptional regulator
MNSYLYSTGDLVQPPQEAPPSGSSGSSAAPAPPGKTRAKGAATERALREAARRVIARDGYVNARIGDIAAEAGRSPGSFYNYFPNKAALLAALAEEFQRTALGRFRQAQRTTALSPRQAVEEGVRAYWETYRDHLGEMVGVFQASMMDPAFARRWREIRSGAIAIVADLVRDLQETGHCRDLEPDLAGSAVASILEHFCYVWQAQGGDAIGDGVRCDDESAIRTLAAMVYHALYWK